MEQKVKYAVALVVLAVWAVAMVRWVVLEGILPDPVVWGVPGGVVLLLFPQRQDKTSEDK